MIFTDQLGNDISLEKNPERIISLVPSQSEFLWDIGLKNEIIGITKFCIHPGEMFSKVERIGGTKTLNIEKIRSLKPDLIIGNKEENEKEQIEILQKEFNVWMSDIYSLNDSLKMMDEIGKMTGREKESKKVIEKIRSGFKDSKAPTFGKAIYLIWKDPFIAAGKNTFIDEMLSYCGFENAIKETRYPQITAEKISLIRPEYILLSSEPYPFAEKHIQELKRFCTDSKIILADGEFFSWYGSRLQYAPDYFKKLRENL